ncbi:MAG: hypothetical protein JW751_31980, partial [Polyangiaceae bacterium]|nr:hypothetical protein [Polyangiaceae bacterium]
MREGRRGQTLLGERRPGRYAIEIVRSIVAAPTAIIARTFGIARSILPGPLAGAVVRGSILPGPLAGALFRGSVLPRSLAGPVVRGSVLPRSLAGPVV